MANHVCPWWVGYLLVSPIRKWLQNPNRILRPYIRDGMTVLDLGSGMGFFTLEAARLVGPSGRVIAADIQEKMLSGVRRRARRAGLDSRIGTLLMEPDGFDPPCSFDFCLAFAVMHEAPRPEALFRSVGRSLKAGGKTLLCEPRSHVSEDLFGRIVQSAHNAGFRVIDQPDIPRARSMELTYGRAA